MTRDCLTSRNGQLVELGCAPKADVLVPERLVLADVDDVLVQECLVLADVEDVLLSRVRCMRIRRCPGRLSPGYHVFDVGSRVL